MLDSHEACHSERSEESDWPNLQILRCAQNDSRAEVHRLWSHHYYTQGLPRLGICVYSSDDHCGHPAGRGVELWLILIHNNRRIPVGVGIEPGGLVLLHIDAAVTAIVVEGVGTGGVV